MCQRVRYNNKRVRDSRISNLELFSPSEQKMSKLDLISPTVIKKIFDSSDDEVKPGTSTSFANTIETPSPSSSGNGTDLRKKFYIVQNDKKSNHTLPLSKRDTFRTVRKADSDRSEKFTDFLHLLKHDDSDSEDDPVFVRMTDRWREKWNRDVQMPFNDSVPQYLFMNEDCRNRPPLKKILYKRTSRLVLQADKTYVSSNSHVKVLRVPIYHYLITDEDEAWLNVINAHKASENFPPISNETFLKVMDSLEVDSYKGIHDGLLKQLCSPCKSEIDDDAVCDVCRSPECEQDDPIVFCDGCNVGVCQLF
uniref:Enhancer of polycomb-like N-terminal domain-containing protein n=1 Tax=Acrobeloides nanus TaxID=290746 RepID=A0A914DHU4_9BILA